MAASDILPGGRLNVTIGGLSREALMAELVAAGVRLNVHAETLLAHAALDRPTSAQVVSVTERSVSDLGLLQGGSLSAIILAAEAHGLTPCPPATGPYLRLAVDWKSPAPDSILSTGRAPTGSLTVVSRPLRQGFEFPKGFYLRNIGGETWLRGYRCDDDHVWSPADRLAFHAPRSR